MGGRTVVNLPEFVKRASNKLTTFNTLDPDITPNFTDDPTVASTFRKVVCRTDLTGHSGSGIVMWTPGDGPPPVDAPLYVEYIPKSAEYRIHVGFIDGTPHVIDVTRKIRDPERTPTNWEVRNHNNGFIFARNNVNPPADVIDFSIRAVSDLGLCFGAVDVVWNEHRQRAYVLEVNTAPGISGQTVTAYGTFFRRKLGGVL